MHGRCALVAFVQTSSRLMLVSLHNKTLQSFITLHAFTAHCVWAKHSLFTRQSCPLSEHHCIQVQELLFTEL